MTGTAPSLVLPADLRREGERLFEFSMWLLGCDVRQGGNLLLRRRLIREPRPHGQEGTSAYSVVLEGGASLTLWGFGALCRAWGEAVFIPRAGFSPRLVASARLASPLSGSARREPMREPLTPRELGVARAALVVLAEWLAEHEEWVAVEVGLAYRRECLAARSKAPPVPVEALAAAWRRLAARVRALEPGVDDFLAPALKA